jgi:FkbM family methyltransferase
MNENVGLLLLDPAIWRAFFSWPKFSLTSYRMVSSLSLQGIRPRTVIDVGANVGQFAVASAKIFPDVTVHSFEPLPDCVRKLEQNLKRLSRTHVYPIALGDEKGEVTMNVNSHSHSSSILALGDRHRKAFPHAQQVATIKVRLSTLDDELGSAPLDGPVLLKLDVQGYESQVLKGAASLLNRVDHVLLEASFRPMYEGEKTFIEIVQIMDERGFEFLRPVGWLDDPVTQEVLQVDALFAKSRVRE